MKKASMELVPGQKVGKLTLIERGFLTYTSPSGVTQRKTTWRARCDCGTVVAAVRQEKLISGSTRSCGCIGRRAHYWATRNLSSKSML